MHGIPGYLTQVDAGTWLALCRCQTERGVRGSFGDIGIYFGRSYFLFRLLAQEGERVFGSDLFTVGAAAGKAAGRQFDTFLAAGGRLGLPVDQEHVFTGDSGGLDPEALAGAVGPVRFLSIDGGHRLSHIRTDGALADRLLHEGGIIAFDDFFNPHWPEVTQGVLAFLETHADRYALFGYSRKKAYVAHTDHVEAYARCLKALPGSLPLRVEEVDFLGRRVPFLAEPYGVMVRQKMNDTLGRGVLPILKG